MLLFLGLLSARACTRHRRTSHKQASTSSDRERKREGGGGEKLHEETPHGKHFRTPLTSVRLQPPPLPYQLSEGLQGGFPRILARLRFSAQQWRLSDLLVDVYVVEALKRPVDFPVLELLSGETQHGLLRFAIGKWRLLRFSHSGPWGRPQFQKKSFAATCCVLPQNYF